MEESMGYTVGSLYKELGKLIEQGHKRKPICINKRTFQHPCEDDGAVILPVLEVALEFHGMIDDDGGQAFNKDGSERMKTSVLLKGGSSEEL
jgi:hypothetical protein